MSVTTRVCPFCKIAYMLSDGSSHSGDVICDLPSRDGAVGVWAYFWVCGNPDCRRVEAIGVHGTAHAYRQNGEVHYTQHPHFTERFRLRPTEADERALPGAVPEPIRRDFGEACSILSLSPKAAATLARRALQGMIRDFHGISKPRLKDEIDALKGLVDDDVWRALDGLRHIGNIGAHMERDVNVIVDVDPDEADRLVRLIELLADDWYVARERRRALVRDVIGIAEEKKALQKGAPPEPVADP